MIDLHCDTIMQLLDHPDSGDLYRNTWKIDIEKLQTKWFGRTSLW